MKFTGCVFKLCDSCTNRVASFRDNLCDLPFALQGEWDHDPVLKDLFRDRAQFVAGTHLIACFYDRREFPFLLLIQGLQVSPALEEKSVLLGQLRQRILQAVKNLSQKPGPELDAQKLSRKLPCCRSECRWYPRRPAI